MNEELDYAEMLEIPVSTVNVVKKKSIFKRRAQPQIQQEDLKAQVLESVNERVGAYVYSEDVSDPPKPDKKAKIKEKVKEIGQKDKGTAVLITEAIAIGVIAIAIFLTNVFMPNSVINTFISSFTATAESEPAYTEFTLAPVVSEYSDAEVNISDNGVLSFTCEGSVYPICKGKVSKVYENDGSYTVEIAHTSTFTSVVTGLTNVYSAVGASVVSNIPMGYSDGTGIVQVTMYDNGTLLNCYTMSGEVPVWKS